MCPNSLSPIFYSTKKLTYFPTKFFLKNSLASNPSGSSFSISSPAEAHLGPYTPIKNNFFIRVWPVLDLFKPTS